MGGSSGSGATRSIVSAWLYHKFVTVFEGIGHIQLGIGTLERSQFGRIDK